MAKHFMALITAISFNFFLQACSKAEVSELPQEDQIFQSEIPTDFSKKNSEIYLTDAERDHFAKGLNLPTLGADDRHDLRRRLSFERSRAIENKDFEQAREFHKYAYQITLSLIKDFPEVYHHKLSLSVNIAALGKLEKAAGNLDFARDHINDSFRILDENPPAADVKELWLRMVMWRHRDLGDIEKQLKNYDAARENYTQYLNYVIKNPSHGDYDYDHAEAYYFLGELSFEQENWAEAAEHYTRSIRLLKKLIKTRLTNGNTRDELIIWQRLANTYARYGYTAFVQQDNETASLAFAEAIKARKAAINAEFATLSEELDLAISYYNAAKYADGKDDEYYQSALDIFRHLKTTNNVPAEYNKLIKEIELLIGQ